MTYVEWLRVRGCLRTCGIILAILVALGIVMRISFARYMSPETWLHHVSMEPGTQQTNVVLPDGTKRTIYDNLDKQEHVVIDNHGSSGMHIVITEPTAHEKGDADHFSIGSVQVNESRHGSMTTTVVDTNGSVPMLYYMALADIVALIVATLLAAPFAREIEGHLEIVMTKPISRVRYALEAIGVDILGILAASIMTIVAFYLCQLLFETPRLDFSGINSRAIAMGLLLPLAWYAMLAAATSWFPRNYGAVLGFAWPVVLLIGGLSFVQPSNIVALFIHDVAWGLSRLSPLTYTSFNISSQMAQDQSLSHFTLRLSMEALLFVVYGALAIWRWQRVEA